jgi:SAM-dependent methyltransferase
MSTQKIGVQQTSTNFLFAVLLLALAVAITGCNQAPVLKSDPSQGASLQPVSQTQKPPLTAEVISKARQDLLREVATIAALSQEPITLDWLAGVKHLPTVDTRTLYRHKSTRAWFTQTEYDASGLKIEEVNQVLFDEKSYYATFYGTPIAYSLVLDIVGQLGYKTLKGLKIIDYGYGAVCTARLSAAAGAQVVGFDVDPMLAKLYNQNQDQGLVNDRQVSAQRTGSIALIHKPFPNNASATDAAASSDLIITKNTLKKGFVRPASGKAMIDLGMTAGQYLNGFAKALKPGGHLVIYNLSQRLDPNNYRPANEGGSPFSQEEFSAAGFKVIYFEQSDNEKVRRFGEALGWGGPQGMGDLQTNLFAQYTVLQRLPTVKAP